MPAEDAGPPSSKCVEHLERGVGGGTAHGCREGEHFAGAALKARGFFASGGFAAGPRRGIGDAGGTAIEFGCRSVEAVEVKGEIGAAFSRDE